MAREIIEFDYEIVHYELSIPVKVEAEIYFYNDKNYGADADGNRGTPRTFVEDIDVLSIQNGVGSQVVVDEAEMENIKDRARTIFLER